jgi:hypothetical protein
MAERNLDIFSHSKVWHIEQKFYSFGDFVLDMPIPIKDAAYFCMIALVVFVLHMTIPVISTIPAVLKFILVPLGLSQFLLKMKLDGKPPQIYLVAWLRYSATKGTYMERFAVQSGQSQRVKLSWLCSHGRKEEERV